MQQALLELPLWGKRKKAKSRAIGARVVAIHDIRRTRTQERPLVTGFMGREFADVIVGMIRGNGTLAADSLLK